MKQTGAFQADKSRFDKGAATWDENAERKARSNAIAAEYGNIIGSMPSKPDLFDYGCGTGQSILPVAAKCKSVTGGDFSIGMLGKFMENAKAEGAQNARTLCCDLDAQHAPDERFDMITCSMTMHHIADIPGLLSKFALMLRPGGTIALVDLETEDGSFHGDDTSVAHKGFDKTVFATQMERAGFANVGIRTVYRMRKEKNGREYPLFIATATKQ
jgi:ubiquinone/menaquinone biosynthesis C-methylase UbiE